MSKTIIDYSNTIIYKITCKDPEVKDVYVGHTTNFVQRKLCHKQSCNNPKSPSHDCKVYKVIRDNGGWDNWNMSIIDFYNCSDQYEARKKEQEYFMSLNATLNSIEPVPTSKPPIENKVADQEYNCNISNKQVCNNKLPCVQPIKNDKYCEICDYTCSRKSDYNKHLTTTKHINRYTQLHTSHLKKYTCSCGKEYKHRQGLYFHRKTCNINEGVKVNADVVSNDDTLLKSIAEIIKSNSDIQKQNKNFKEIIMMQNKIIEQNSNLLNICKDGIKV
jgi:hypothetical protein